MKEKLTLHVKVGGFSMRRSRTGFHENRDDPSVISRREGLRVDARDAFSCRNANIRETLSQVFDEID
jgi:hypothetical protein